MSANNQILLKRYKGKYYVFDVMAESWGKTNRLSISEANRVFDDFQMAWNYANKIDETEYGVSDRLVKDGAKVTLVDTKKKGAK